MPAELNKKEQLLNTSDFNSLSDNVKGLQSSKKRLKFFQFFENQISFKVILFLQKVHSLKVPKKYGVMNLMLTYFFPHGKTNSCGVLISFYDNINYYVKKSLSDNSGRILVLDVTIDSREYLFFDRYNRNTEPKELKVLESISKILKDFKDLIEKYIIFAGDFNLFF